MSISLINTHLGFFRFLCTLPQPSIAAWRQRPCVRSLPARELSSETSARSWTAGGGEGCDWQTASPGSTSSHTAPRCSPWTHREAQGLLESVLWQDLMWPWNICTYPLSTQTASELCFQTFLTKTNVIFKYSSCMLLLYCEIFSAHFS